MDGHHFGEQPKSCALPCDVSESHRVTVDIDIGTRALLGIFYPERKIILVNQNLHSLLGK